MRHRRTLTLMIAATAMVAACGSDSTSEGSEPADSVRESQAATPADAPQLPDATPATAAATDPPAVADEPADANSSSATSSASAASSPAVQQVQTDQPAIWPAPDAVLATPEQAAAAFVTEVLGVDPVLGDYRAGDARSGEIAVFSPGEVEGADLLERGVLALRMLGPNDGWFVIAATSAGITIDAPAALEQVAAGPLVVTGEGRGFEGTLNALAFRPGDADDVLDLVIGRGGPFEAVEPFDVTLDLSDAAPGEVLAVIVRGDTGLGGDPGEFAAVPIVIGGTLPAST